MKQSTNVEVKKVVLTVKVVSLELSKDKHSRTGKSGVRAVANIKIGNGELIYTAIVRLRSKHFWLSSIFNADKFKNDDEYIESEKNSFIEQVFDKTEFILDAEDVMDQINKEFDKPLGTIDGNIEYLTVDVPDLFSTVKTNEDMGIETEIDFNELKKLFLDAVDANSRKEGELKILNMKEYYKNNLLVVNFDEIKKGLNSGITAELNYSSADEYVTADNGNIVMSFNFKYKQIESESLVASVENIYTRSHYNPSIKGKAIQLRERYNYVANYKKVSSLVKKVNEKFEDFVYSAKLRIDKIEKYNFEEEWFKDNFSYPVEIKNGKKYHGHGRNAYSTDETVRKIKIVTEEKEDGNWDYVYGYSLKFGYDCAANELSNDTKFVIYDIKAQMDLEVERKMMVALFETGEYYKSGMNLSSLKFTKDDLMKIVKRIVEVAEPVELNHSYK